MRSGVIKQKLMFSDFISSILFNPGSNFLKAR